MTSNKTNFLMVGGTGKTGRRVADRLRARNLAVRSASCGSAPPFEWSDRTTGFADFARDAAASGAWIR